MHPLMPLYQQSLKKIMVMLGRVRRRQCDDDPTLARCRPAESDRLKEFYKAVRVTAQRQRYE